MIATAVQQPQTAKHTSITNSQRNSKGIAIQAKLTVGKPNDKYEQEADRIADKVMRMPDRATVLRKCAACKEEEKKIQQKPLAVGITPWVQRQVAEEQEEDRVQTKPLQRQAEEEEEAIQPKIMLQKQTTGGPPQPGASLESRLNRSKSGGSPLPDNTRSFMESRIGADFSNVKIHTDDNAVQMSQDIGAQAFTHGNHIYFNSGKYSPDSFSGKHLLAHEMVHTIQQHSLPVVKKRIQRQVTRQQNLTRLHEIDGCSGGIAQDPTNYGGLYIPYITGRQQYNRESTRFGQPQPNVSHNNLNQVMNLPCNKHDICYQTCGTTQQQCDDQMLEDMNTVCNNAYPQNCNLQSQDECEDYFEERNLCFELANRVHTGLRNFGSGAFEERQTQYCIRGVFANVVINNLLLTDNPYRWKPALEDSKSSNRLALLKKGAQVEVISKDLERSKKWNKTPLKYGNKFHWWYVRYRLSGRNPIEGWVMQRGLNIIS